MSVDRRDELRAQLVQGCQKVPPAFAHWNHQTAVAFKDCVKKCQKIVAKPRASEGELQAAVNDLAGFWR